MNTRKISTLSLMLCSMSVAAATPSTSQTSETAVQQPAMLSVEATIQQQPANPLVYSYDEMFNFDIEAFLASQAPHLLPYAEHISHWAGYSSISPKVLLVLMEQQSGVLRDPKVSQQQLAQPFAHLSAKTDFSGQLQDVADQLATRLYSAPIHPAAAEFNKQQTSSALDFLFESAVAQVMPEASLPTEPQALAQRAAARHFKEIYQQLFAEEFAAISTRPKQQTADEPVLMAGPANGFLQFPFPLGQSWHVGGAHTNNGSGSYPMSSLDMSQGGGWGSNQSGRWVSASAAGSFKRHSSCFAEVVHSGG